MAAGMREFPAISVKHAHWKWPCYMVQTLGGAIDVILSGKKMSFASLCRDVSDRRNGRPERSG